MLKRIIRPSLRHPKRPIALLMAALALAGGASSAAAQEVGVKTNILYDATTTPNLGVEFGVGGRSTINITYGLNPWEFDSDRHGKRYAKHWVVMPEYRWWCCQRMAGHFFGVHAMGGQLNVSNIDLPVPGAFFKWPKLNDVGADVRYQGAFLGGGLTYGYQYPFSRHWNLEAEIGVGYAHVWTDKYPCSECGTRLGKEGANYLGVTKLGLSIMYVF